MLHGDRISFGQTGSPLHQIMQFADIARPMIAGQKIQHFRFDHELDSLLFADEIQKMIEQQYDVVAPFAKSRSRDRNHIQTVIQILPESSPFHFFGEIFIGSTDQPYVRRNHPVAADAGDCFFLDDSEQGDLVFQRHITDFIQK